MKSTLWASSKGRRNQSDVHCMYMKNKKIKNLLLGNLAESKIPSDNGGTLTFP